MPGSTPGTLSEPEFEALAEKTLSRLADAVEDAGGDAELAGGILTISGNDGRTFLLNKHAPLKQLWYSSPVSGAHHYEPRNGAWVSTRDGSDFEQRLVTELAQADIEVEID